MRTRMLSTVLAVLVTSSSLASPSYGAGILSKGKKELPHCAVPLASVSIELPKEVTKQQWGEMGLDAPSNMLKQSLQESNCFRLTTSRGKSDYYLRPSLSFTEGNMYGSTIGSLVGLIPGAGLIGALGGSVAGFQAGKSRVSAELELLNTRDGSTAYAGTYTFASNVMSSEERALLAQGNSSYRSAGDSYYGTQEGRKVVQAYQSALAELVANFQRESTVQSPETGRDDSSRRVAFTSKRTATASSQKFTVDTNVNLREGPSTREKVARSLAPGDLLYPTGEEAQGWVEVEDKTQFKGWVLKTLLQPAT